MIPSGGAKTGGGLGSGGGMNLGGNRTGGMFNTSAPSAQGSATGRLPGAMNMPSTIGTGGTMDWAKNFRAQQTGMPIETPFNPDTSGGAVLPNGPQVGGFLSMFQGQGGMPPAQPPVDNYSDPFQGTGSPPAAPQPNTPPAGGGGYMDALGSLTSTPIGPPPSSPERDAARAERQAQMDQEANDRWLQQAFEFTNNPVWANPRDYGVSGLEGFKRGWGWEDATQTYAGNPYISEDMRRTAYGDYQREKAEAQRARDEERAFLAG